jgi:hypothetical protein
MKPFALWYEMKVSAVHSNVGNDEAEARHYNESLSLGGDGII